MLIVGSDRITLSGVASAPDGPRHAVDDDGRVLCRSSRPRFTWPALAWEPAADGEACSLCAQVHMAHEALLPFDPYPSGGALALAPRQPSPGLFVPNEQ